MSKHKANMCQNGPKTCQREAAERSNEADARLNEMGGKWVAVYALRQTIHRRHKWVHPQVMPCLRVLRPFLTVIDRHLQCVPIQST